MSSRLPDSIRRAIRTFVQVFVGYLILQLMEDGSFVAPLTVWGSYLDAAAIATLPTVLALLQNAAEDRGIIPAPLKLPTPAPGVEDPLA